MPAEAQRKETICLASARERQSWARTQVCLTPSSAILLSTFMGRQILQQAYLCQCLNETGYSEHGQKEDRDTPGVECTALEGGLAPRNYLLPTLGKHTYEPRMFLAPYAWVHPQSQATASHNPSMSELELSNKPTAQVRKQAKTEVPNSIKSQQIQNPT